MRKLLLTTGSTLYSAIGDQTLERRCPENEDRHGMVHGTTKKPSTLFIALDRCWWQLIPSSEQTSGCCMPKVMTLLYYSIVKKSFYPANLLQPLLHLFSNSAPASTSALENRYKSVLDAIFHRHKELFVYGESYNQELQGQVNDDLRSCSEPVLISALCLKRVSYNTSWPFGMASSVAS